MGLLLVKGYNYISVTGTYLFVFNRNKLPNGVLSAGYGQSPPAGPDQAGHSLPAHLQGNNRGEDPPAGQVNTVNNIYMP